MRTQDLIVFWQQAIAEPFGVKIRTPDPLRLDGLLRMARKRAMDPDLEILSLYRDPDEPMAVLWIMKNPNKVRSAA